MPVPILDLAPQHQPLLPQMKEAFERLVNQSSFVLGPVVADFEAHLAQACAVEHAVGVSSGTDALLLGLMALEIGPGDEVLTTPFTFFATAGTIARVGARPVFVDIDPVTFNLDPAALSAAVTPRTRAIMPVHLYGQMADMKAIEAAAGRHGLAVIEDACQAIGARRDGRVPGQGSTVAALSFYPTKNLSAIGDAGACLTADAALAGRMRALRTHGETSRYHHALIGGNFRLDALQAAVLDLKLPHLEAWNEERRRLAARYGEAFAELARRRPVIPPAEAPGAFHVFHQYTLRIGEGRRDALAGHLRERGVGHGIYYPVPLHLQECFASLGGAAGQFPAAEQAAREVLSLPIYPGLSPAAQEEVVRTVKEFFS